MFVTGVVLAAGGSRRLGEPKQLLPYRGGRLLDATLTMARSCGFDQLIVTLGGSADRIRVNVDLAGAEVVESQDFGSGCGSSVRSAAAHVDERAEGLVLLLGDQPGVTADSVRQLLEGIGQAPLGSCRYHDGLGHPFWVGRRLFGQLRELHGDKAIWKMMHSGRYDTVEVPVRSRVPLDVDTWDDYQALLERDTGAAS